MGRKRGKVCGMGINDAEYNVHMCAYVDGKRKIIWVCPFYRKWQNMLERCYSDKWHERHPTYTDCTVCEEWHTFSNFRNWMEGQDWENKNLDKDLLNVGNKEYNPTNCVFVAHIVNTFLTDSAKSRGAYPIGVRFNNVAKKFEATCRNPFTGKQDYLGLYNCPDEAHLAWKVRKHELACQLADSEYVTDERVEQALRTRYL